MHELLTLIRSQNEILRQLADPDTKDRDHLRENLSDSAAKLAAKLGSENFSVKEWNQARKEARDGGHPIVYLSDVAILVGKHLDGIDLSDANLEGVDLSYTKLTGAKFKNVDLTKTTGLRVTALAGSDLRGAILPEKVAFDLGYSENAAKIGRNTFIIMILASFYVLISFITIDDENFFQRSFSGLPFVKEPTTPLIFFVISPFLLGTLYLYFVSYLSTLWEEYAGLPTYFENGRHVTRRIFPWLFNDFVSRLMKEARAKNELSWLRGILIFLFSWFSIPLIVFFQWWSFLKLHHWGSYLHVILFGGIAYVGLYYHQEAKWILRDGVTETLNIWSIFKASLPLCLLTGLAVAFMGLISYRIVHGDSENNFFLKLRRLDISEMTFEAKDQPRGKKNKISNLNHLQAVGLKFSGINLSKVHLEDGMLDGASLERGDFTRARVCRTSLVGAHLDGAKMKGAHLESANLTSASLLGADLQGAYLQGAVLKYTNLNGANFRNTDLTGTIFYPKKQNDSKSVIFPGRGSSSDGHFLIDGTDFFGADFNGVSLSGVDFSRVKEFSRVNLKSTCLEYARFDGRSMVGAVLDHAQLKGASLREARLVGASVADANFNCADLSGADISGLKNWERTYFENANLYGVQNPPPGFMEWAIGDGGAVVLDPGEWAEYRDKNLKQAPAAKEAGSQ